MRQRAEVSTPTEMIPHDRRGKSRGGGGRRALETKEKSKASSKKKERLNGGVGNGTGATKKSRNKSSSAAADKGRVAAWLDGIDPAVSPQEEIIPPNPSVVRDLDDLSFEDEQSAVVGRSPLATAASLFSLYPDSPSTPGGALTFNVQPDVTGDSNHEDKSCIGCSQSTFIRIRAHRNFGTGYDSLAFTYLMFLRSRCY